MWAGNPRSTKSPSDSPKVEWELVISEKNDLRKDLKNWLRAYYDEEDNTHNPELAGLCEQIEQYLLLLGPEEMRIKSVPTTNVLEDRFLLPPKLDIIED